MKSLNRFTVCFVVAAMALLAAGCPKRPLRPNPSQTMVGPSGQDTLSPFDVGVGGNLEQRLPGSSIDNADFTQFQPVLFDFDSAAIRVSERSKVQAAADYLKNNSGARLVLVGRCDWRGTTEYNMGLGDRRGRSVRDFMATFGVAADAIEIISKGDLDAQEGATADQMQQDRRVDIGIVQQ